MEILKVTEENALAVSRIYALSWKTAYQNIVPQEYLDTLSLECRTPVLLDSPYSGFVLKDGEEYIATSSVSAARDEKMHGFGEIISIYVLPEYSRRGYGKRLFAYVLNYLQELGYKNVYLWSYRIKKPPKRKICAPGALIRGG